MEQKLIRKVLQIEGMTCSSCEMRIENALKKLGGMVEVKAMFSSSNVYITYDPDQLKLNQIIDGIEKLDYKVKNKPDEQSVSQVDKKKENKAEKSKGDKTSVNQLIAIGIIVLALYVIVKNTIGFNFIPQVNQNMGYGILFVIGLITSLHCMAMCGGINLSQCASYSTEKTPDNKLAVLKPSLMYNAGRVISYTVIGGIVGGLGSVVSFSGAAKGIIAILAGIFMVIMGINMMNVFPWLRKLNPRMPRFFGNKIYNNNGKRGPLYVGLLNGLMPCGPLQAMQLYALGTGSILAGATSMFLFSLGTVPLMFGLGALSSVLSGKYTKKMMKVSAVLVVILGVIMVGRGMNLSGISINAIASPLTGSASGSIAKLEGNVQNVTTTLDSGKYTPITVQKGIPVKWIIKATASDINGCNGTLTIPKFGIEKKLVPGDNTIEFTPNENGTIPYTCWMGMISSTIKVVSNIKDVKQTTSNTGSSGNLGGGCCAGSANATKFRNGKIPTDNIQIAKITGDQQEVTVTVNDSGYSPAVVVVQKGIQTEIKFNPEKLNSCNSQVIFPDYNGGLNLQNGETETPLITPEQDFTFQCGMGMLHGYVKVVDDINKINLDDIRKEVQNYKPAAGSTGGGCCG